MQLSLFRRTILTYESGGFYAAADILDLFNVRLIPITTETEARKKACDGVLLLGGQDISPAWYGEANLYANPANRERDAIEWALTRRALAQNQAVMGICRGSQMLAVAAGGSLYQDIYRQKVTKKHPGFHPITAKDPLRRFLPELVVNSRHHQAIRSVPYGWKTLATAPDGIIEAIWRPGALGVQWHPEDLFYQNHHWHGLFGWFVDGLR